jgi:hypothetical protein
MSPVTSPSVDEGIPNKVGALFWRRYAIHRWSREEAAPEEVDDTHGYSGRQNL